MISAAFSSSNNAQLLLLSGASGDNKILQLCDIESSCIDSSGIALTGANSVNLKISEASYPKQTQYIFEGTFNLNKIDQDFAGNVISASEAVVQTCDNVVASPFNINDVLCLDSTNSNSVKLISTSYDTSDGSVLGTTATDAGDISSISNVIDISLKTSNEFSIYSVDSGTNLLTTTSFNFDSIYSKAKKIMYQPSKFSAGFSFYLDSSLESLQIPIDYDYMQKYYWHSQETSIKMNILSDSELIVETPSNSKSFAAIQNPDSANSGLLTKTNSTPQASHSPGSIKYVEYVDFKYKNQDGSIFTEAYPVRIGCPDKMVIEFDDIESNNAVGEGRKLNVYTPEINNVVEEQVKQNYVTVRGFGWGKFF